MPLVLLAIASTSCDSKSVVDIPRDAEGYKPIYAATSTLKEVSYEPAKSIVIPGKIYYRGGYIFQVDNGTGIHILNAQNPSAAKRIGFISIKGCNEIAITGNHLFTNNYADLITVDITDFTTPKVVKRVEGAFDVSDNELPPERGFFECPDNSKGVIIGWRKEMLQSPKCSNF